MFYPGMDVAKAKLDCCLLLDETAGVYHEAALALADAGINATGTPQRIRQSLDSIEFLGKQLAGLQQDIDLHIDRHLNLKHGPALLQSIPAVGRFGAGAGRAFQSRACPGFAPCRIWPPSWRRAATRMSKPSMNA